MARTLAANVHVGGQFFEAGSSPDKEYADQITNPKAWGESDDNGQSESSSRRTRRNQSE